MKIDVLTTIHGNKLLSYILGKILFIIEFYHIILYQHDTVDSCITYSYFKWDFVIHRKCTYIFKRNYVNFNKMILLFTSKKLCHEMVKKG